MTDPRLIADTPARKLLAPPRHPGQRSAQNLSALERWASAAVGAALAAASLRWKAIPRAALAAAGVGLLYRGASGRCGLYKALGVTTKAESREDIERRLSQAGVLVRRAITIRAEPAALYAFWRDFTNLSRFLRHIRSVESVDESGKKTRWTATGPFGMTYQWEAELVNDVPGEIIAWRSLEGSDVDHAGTVEMRPAPGDRGTELRVTLKYSPRSGYAGIAVAKLFNQDPAAEIDDDLRVLKQILETGEMATVDGQPSGRDDPRPQDRDAERQELAVGRPA